MSRPIHFVGSLGGAKDVSSAMELMLSQRDHLFWLPDGEPAERSGYVRSVIENLAARHLDQKTSSPECRLEIYAAADNLESRPRPCPWS